MERTDVVDAQTMTSGQLAAVRDRVVVDRMTLRKAVKSLYPNFDVNSKANMQDLEMGLRDAYPEMAAALKAVNAVAKAKKKQVELSNVRSQNGISEDTALFQIDFKKVPTGASAFNEFKMKAVEVLNAQLEAERLKRVALANDKKLV